MALRHGRVIGGPGQLAGLAVALAIIASTLLLSRITSPDVARTD